MSRRESRCLFPIWLALSLCLAPAVFGEARIELQGGQQISGTDLRLVNGDYLLELEPGKVLSIPAELVVRVRLSGGDRAVEDEVTDAHPTGLTFTVPRQLVGEPVKPARRTEQLEVLGPPARFAGSVIDPAWRPSGEWARRPPGVDFHPAHWADGVIDPYWIPRSGFRPGDVLRAGQATWRSDIVDVAWRPSDAFEPRKRILTPPPRLALETLPDATEPGMAQTLAGDCAWCDAAPLVAAAQPRVERGKDDGSRDGDALHCARSIFARAPDFASSAEIEIHELPRNTLSDLPLTLHEATRVQDGERTRAVFTAGNGRCVLLAGDLRRLGVAATAEQTARYTRSAYDAALDRAPGTAFASDDEAVRYAFAIAALTEAGTSASPGADFVLLDDARTLEALLAPPADACRASRGRQRRAAKQAARAFETPRVLRDAQGTRVAFDAWSQVGGRMLRYAVVLPEDGQVAIAREGLVEHVGRHADR